MRLFLLWFLIASPALPFIALSLSYWRIVRQKIDEALRRLHAFPSELYGQAYGSFSKEEQDPYGVMKAELEAFHNWRTYYVPIALTCVIASIFVAISLLHFGVDIGLPDDFARMGQRTLPTVIVGAGGAYLWGVHDLIRRHRTADMSSTALHTTWLRMLVSAAIGALIGGLFETDFELIAAFAVGALPIEDAKQWLTAKLNLNLNNLPSHPPDLHLIQGMSVGVQSRLMDENIDRVQALAFADPVRLLFRTNIEWNVILDLVDQAMLINFAGDKIGDVRLAGARGAIEFASLYQLAEDGTPEEQDRARKTLAMLGRALGADETLAAHMAYQYYHDPLVSFVWQHWEPARSLIGSEDEDGNDGEDEEGGEDEEAA